MAEEKISRDGYSVDRYNKKRKIAACLVFILKGGDTMPILFLIAGSIILVSVLKHRRRRRAGPRKAIRAVSARNQTQKPPQTDQEKERRAICRDYNRRIKSELEKKQARDDIDHLEQRKRDLLTAYSKIPDNNDERTIKRRITYDNAIRNTEKQIERAYMILHRTY